MRISDWSSDVCSSDVAVLADRQAFHIVDIDWRNEFGQPLHENSRFAVAARDDPRPLDPRRDAVHQRIAPEQQQKPAIEIIRIGWPSVFGCGKLRFLPALGSRTACHIGKTTCW